MRGRGNASYDDMVMTRRKGGLQDLKKYDVIFVQELKPAGDND